MEQLARAEYFVWAEMSLDLAAVVRATLESRGRFVLLLFCTSILECPWGCSWLIRVALGLSEYWMAIVDSL